MRLHQAVTALWFLSQFFSAWQISANPCPSWSVSLSLISLTGLDHSSLFLFLPLSSLRSRFQLQTAALFIVSFIFLILFSGQTEPFLLCASLHWSSFFSLLSLHDLLQTKAVSAQQDMFSSCREYTLIPKPFCVLAVQSAKLYWTFISRDAYLLAKFCWRF